MHKHIIHNNISLYKKKINIFFVNLIKYVSFTNSSQIKHKLLIDFCGKKSIMYYRKVKESQSQDERREEKKVRYKLK